MTLKIEAGSRWTPERDEILKRLLAKGMSHGKIAAEMGVSRNTICGRVWRMKRAGKI